MKIARRVVGVGLGLAALVLPIVAAPPPATAVPSVPPLSDVVAGLYHSCGISSGAVLCWGTNNNGVLGNPSVAASWSPIAVDVAGTPLEGKTVVRLEADAWATCALTSEGQLACWGSNYQGVNGTGDTTPVPKPAAVTTAGTPLAGTTVTDYAVGTAGACALTATNVIACWGRNTDGQVGSGDTDIHRVPTAVHVAGTVLEGKTIADVSMRFDHACAVTTDGIGACWGSGTYGRLGTGTTDDALTPVPIKTTGTALAGKTLRQIATGSDTSCALATDSTIACWGGPSASPSTAVEIVRTGTPLAGKTIVELTRDVVTCARASDGTVACWGSNADQMLGVASSSSTTTPVSPTATGTALAGKTVASIDTGASHTCATLTDGSAACWGKNTYGQLGRGTTEGGWQAELVRYGTPTPPLGVGAVGGPRQITASWSVPAQTGGIPIAGYHVVASPAAGPAVAVDVAASARSAVVPGLVNGTPYMVTIAAVNEVGTGAASAGVAATPAALPSTFAPEGSWAAWTARQFHDVVGRAPTAAETSSWVSQLTATPTKKGVLVDSLRRSTENTTAVDPTVRLYRAFLGRAPDVGGLQFWIKRRRTGTWTLVKMADQFATSTEFTRKYGALTNEQFVRRIYTDVLGRTADPAGVTYWTGRLDAKARTRGSVMVGFSESSEYRRKQAQNTDVAVAFAFLLGRQATGAETADWVARQQAGTTHSDLLLEVLDSVEYTTAT